MSLLPQIREGNKILMDKRQSVIDEIPKLRRFARALSRDRFLADDLVQDCLERALRSLASWSEITNMKAWLFTILRNLYSNHLRSSSRRPDEIPFDEQEGPVTGDNLSQDSGLIIRDLGAALEMLPEQHREVILLVGLEGMNYRETSEILNIPIGTVMSRLSRGRATLRSLMGNGVQSGNPSLRRVE